MTLCVSIASLSGIGLRRFGRQVLVRALVSSVALIVLLALLPSSALAQSPAINVGSATGNAGTSVDLAVNFAPGSTAVATLQFDLTYSTALSHVSTSTGTAAAAAGKSASSSAISGGIRVLIFGINQNAIGAGSIAVVRLSIAPGTPPQVLPVTISGITASDPDANPVATTGSNGSVTVTMPADTTPPVISNVLASNITSTGATISWTTNEASDTQVEYGTTASYGSMTALNSSMVTSHSQNLTGLAASTLYHYRVRSRDAAGNLAISGDYTFTTAAAADTTPPVISSISAANITATGVTISWTTNEASDTQIEYGTTASYGSMTALNSSMVTSHSQNLTGLAASTLYHYRVRSRDAAGNLALSGDYTFTTSAAADTTPPVISNVSASNITSTGGTISWTTNEASDSQVEYGTTTAYGSQTALNSSMVTSHSQNLTGLAASTLYHYRVRSRDAAGNLALSGDHTFTTAAASDTTPPIISDVTVTNVTQSSAVIAWSTNEPSDSQIEFGTTTTYGSLTVLDSEMVTSHSQMVTGLSSKTRYHFRVRSADSSGNLSLSQDLTFTTAEGNGEIKKTFFVPRRRGKKTAGANGDDASYTGLAIVNLESSTATLQFTACNSSGVPLTGPDIANPVTKSLQPGEQLPVIDAELFGPGLANYDGGWIKIQSDVSQVAGFFMNFDSRLAALDGALIGTPPAVVAVLPEIEPQGFTYVGIENPNPEEAHVTLELYGNGGNVLASERRTIPAHGSFEGHLFEDLFEAALPSATGYVRIVSDVPVVSLQVTGKEGMYTNMINGLDATAGSAKLYCPQYAVGGPWRTAISLVNLDARSGLVTLKFYPQDPSQPVDSRSVIITRFGKVYIDDPAFFESLAGKPADVVAQGYLVIESDGIRLTGSVAFGDTERTIFSTTIPLVPRLENSLLFGHVAADDVYFTGLAIINPHDREVFATIDLFGADGKIAYSSTQLIPPRGRSSRLLAQYFPILFEQHRTSGYVRVTADMPIAGFAVFGTHSLSVLSAIPAQTIP